MKFIGIDIIFLLLLIGCILPPISIFYDEYVIPKWYFCGIIVWFALIFRFANSAIKYFRFHYINLCIIIGIESISIIKDILSFQDKNLQIGTTGTFENPATLALLICILLPHILSLHQKRTLRLLLFFFSLFILVLTKSRTGLLTFISIFLFVIYKQKNLAKPIRIITTCTIYCTILFVVLLYKTNSTRGRLFILERTLELIVQNPLLGSGKGSFLRTYMSHQCEYFINHPNDSRAMLADNITHPLNEFFLIGVDYGIIGIVIFMTIMLFPLFRHNVPQSVKLSLLAVFNFCLFSYPLYNPMSWIIIIISWLYIFNSRISKYKNLRLKYRNVGLLVCLLCGCILFMNIILNICWGYVSHRGLSQPDKMIPYYKKLYVYYKRNPYFLYDYAFVLFYDARLLESYNIAMECSHYCSSYDLCLLLGDIERYRNKEQQAIYFYDSAHYMCPCRLAPLEGMLTIYQDAGNSQKVDSIANLIRKAEIKINNPHAFRIKNKV